MDAIYRCPTLSADIAPTGRYSTRSALTNHPAYLLLPMKAHTDLEQRQTARRRDVSVSNFFSVGQLLAVVEELVTEHLL